MSKYKTIGDGSIITVAPKMKFCWTLACCDCGLVHNILVKTSSGKVTLTIYKDNRATGQKRRYMSDIPTSLLGFITNLAERHNKTNRWRFHKEWKESLCHFLEFQRNWQKCLEEGIKK